MRAIVVREFGGPEVLRVEQVDEPTPGTGEVAISVEFVGVNFTDVRNRVGDGLGVVPLTPGVEVSGTVCSVGADVTSLRVGQRVAAFTRGHAYAEVVVAAEALTVVLPDSLVGRPEAAGMLVTLPLALNVLERTARVLDGESVLLHAAAGGVGSVVGQLLRKRPDVTLWGTVSNVDKADFARQHGFRDVFTYADFDREVMARTDGRGVDVVLDPVGGEVQARSLEVLAPFGRLVSYSNISRASQALPDAEWLRTRCIGVLGLSNGQLSARAPDVIRANLERAVALVADGSVQIDVTALFPLEQAAEAHRAFEARTAIGKFVLSV
jgi:NADPH2:quinone reductase